MPSRNRLGGNFSVKISQACNLFDDVHVGDVVVALPVALITESL